MPTCDVIWRTTNQKHDQNEPIKIHCYGFKTGGVVVHFDPS